MTEEIKAKALELGFAAVGFAPAAQAESIAIYRAWLSKGYAGNMAYLERHAPLKEHPANFVPGVKSIIAVAARYPVNPAPQEGGFSTYARGLDYHDVIRAKLRQLSAFIDEELAPPSSKQARPLRRICVDSAPLLEREWALRAGIGWRGKQGQIISPVAGATILLGFLLTDLELKPSSQQENRCGNCRLCLGSCPTGALPGSSEVDARRCLSYLTIEPGAEFPADMPHNLHGRIFGCDSCTAVCPWNRKATAPLMPELMQTAPLPDAAKILSMTEDAFKERFKGTAVYRTGLQHLQQNCR